MDISARNVIKKLSGNEFYESNAKRTVIYIREEGLANITGKAPNINIKDIVIGGTIVVGTVAITVKVVDIAHKVHMTVLENEKANANAILWAQVKNYENIPTNVGNLLVKAFESVTSAKTIA